MSSAELRAQRGQHQPADTEDTVKELQKQVELLKAKLAAAVELGLSSSFFCLCVFYPALSLCFLSHSSGLLASQSSSQSLGCCRILSICLLLLVSFCRMVAASVDTICLCVCQVSLQQLRTKCCAHNSQIQSTRWNSCAKTMWKPEQRYQQSCIRAVQQVQQVQQACLLPHQPEGCGRVQPTHLRLRSE